MCPFCIFIPRLFSTNTQLPRIHYSFYYFYFFYFYFYCCCCCCFVGRCFPPVVR